MLKFTFTPYDILFFGSGRPFNRGDVVDSVFPPFPHTFAGAITSKFKKFADINILKTVYGPFIQNDSKIYFPKPQNIYSKRKKMDLKKFFVVKPLKVNLNLFDPKNTNKPEKIETFPTYIGTENIEAFDGFISIEGLKKWLNDLEIDKNTILGYKDIFEKEPRVGISIDPTFYSIGSRDDALYRIEFLRLKEDFKLVFWAEFNFSNGLQNAGLEDYEKVYDFFNSTPRALKLGGEMKNIHYNVEQNDFKEYIIKNLEIEEKINLNKGNKIKLLFLTYGIFDFYDPSENIPVIEGFKMYSSCYGNYKIVALNSKNFGTKTKRAYPPGTVFWLESNNEESTINSISFFIKNNRHYYLGEPKGRQDFIGANLLLIKKGG